MKILYVGNFGYGWDGSICDEEHIAQALEELGHEVYRHQREHQPMPYSINRQFDFTLIAQWDGYTANQLESINEYGHFESKVVYWSFDHQDQNQEWHNKIIEISDLYLSKRIADSKYTNWQWLSQDFAPSFLDKHPLPVEQDIDVLFTGSYLDWATERNETLKGVDDKFNLVIHSVNDWPGFKDVRPPIMDDGLPEIYARAKVILSIDHTLEAGYWSDRNAQIMACGRRPLFRYVPLSEARFGDKVDYFYSKEDCLTKIENWEERPTNANGLYVSDRVKDLLTIVKGIL